MYLNEYRIGSRLLNSVEAVDYVLAQLLEVEKAKIISAKFDFDKFDLDVMPLIKKVKVQFYFKLKLSELKAHYQHQKIVAIEHKRVDFNAELSGRKLFPDPKPVSKVPSETGKVGKAPTPTYNASCVVSQRGKVFQIKVIGVAKH